MQPIKLYGHQKSGVVKTWALLQQAKNVLLVSPGGSGKTYMMAALAKRILREKKTVLVLAHRKELLQQTKTHFIKLGIDANTIGTLVGGVEDFPDDMRVCIAGIQSYRRRELERADYVLVDEAHHTPAQTYMEILEQHEHGRVVGLTATPVRLDNVGFTKLFDEMVVAALLSVLIAKGIVAKPVCWGADLPDLSDVPKRGGDYNETELGKKLDKPELNGNVLEHYKKRASGKRALGFACSVTHAESLTNRFLADGIPSEFVDGKMNPRKRKDILDRFRTGETLVLWTCQLANEGLDIPAVRVVIMARPTCSFVVYMQQAARCMRRGTRPTILDHADNCKTFGLPHLDRTWSLTGELDEVPQASQTKTCPECENLVTCGEMVCPQCGYQFPVPVRKAVLDESSEELVNLSRGAFMRRVRAFSKKKGYGPEWEKQVMQEYREHLGAA